MLLSEYGKKKPINSTLSLNKASQNASIKRISAIQSYVIKSYLLDNSTIAAFIVTKSGGNNMTQIFGSAMSRTELAQVLPWRERVPWNGTASPGQPAGNVSKAKRCSLLFPYKQPLVCMGLEEAMSWRSVVTCCKSCSSCFSMCPRRFSRRKCRRLVGDKTYRYYSVWEKRGLSIIGRPRFWV